MKKFLLLSAIIATMSCAGQSRITDTICFPVEVVKKVLVAAEQKKALEVQVNLLNDRITGLQSVISNLQQKDSATVKLYTEQMEVMREQKKLYADQLQGYEKLLKRERRKKGFWRATAGVVAAGAGYLLITK